MRASKRASGKSKINRFLHRKGRRIERPQLAKNATATDANPTTGLSTVAALFLDNIPDLEIKPARQADFPPGKTDFYAPGVRKADPVEGLVWRLVAQLSGSRQTNPTQKKENPKQINCLGF